MDDRGRLSVDLREKRRAGRIVLVTYAVAAAAAATTALLLPSESVIVTVAAADVAATGVVFLFSVGYDNSSFYDPYWSVAPLPIALGFAVGGEGQLARQLLVIAAVAVWGARLTFNWWRGWGGLASEDWRYRDLRAQHGRSYWWVSFAGIHMFPTLVVFLGCLSLVPALSHGRTPLGLLDGLAALVTASAIWIEARADRELRAFTTSDPEPEAVLATGLWARSRHPNYFGEMLFWWGLFLFGVAADSSAWWWTLPGPLCITVMFQVVSLPMIEQRMRERRPGYAAVVERTPLVIPRIRIRDR